LQLPKTKQKKTLPIKIFSASLEQEFIEILHFFFYFSTAGQLIGQQ
jgi:hypothetical protein